MVPSILNDYTTFLIDFERSGNQKTAESGIRVITFKVLTPSRQDLFSRACLGTHFFMPVTAFSGEVKILSPNLDPGARVLHVSFRRFFRFGGLWSLKRPKSRPQEAQKPSPRASGNLFEVIFVRFLSRFENNS